VRSHSSSLHGMFEPRQRSIRKLYVNLVTCYVVQSSGRSWHCWFQLGSWPAWPNTTTVKQVVTTSINSHHLKLTHSQTGYESRFQPNNDTIVEDHKFDTGLNNAQILVENKVVDVLQINSTHSAVPILNHNAIENLWPFIWFMHTLIKCDHKYVHVSYPISSH